MKNLILLAILLVASPMAAGVPITVNRFERCYGIQDNSPVNSFSGPFKIAGNQELNCWFEFMGGKETIKYLDARRSLTIRAIWRVGIRNVDKIDIGITAAEWRRAREGAVSEVAAKGFFTWRTFCSKSNFESDRYAIHLVTTGGDRLKDRETMNAFEADIEIQGL
jgi:hypothetical protein